MFFSGAAVLGIEILGTRVLGPFYGVSLFLWSALITVTLIALSIGYMLGGRWADRNARVAQLCWILVGAGAWILLIPLLKQPMLYLADDIGLRLGVLTTAFVLFSPPLTLLGMVSPYAIRLRALHLEEVGRTAGDLYAISTIGSVCSALLTGFILIPNIGVERLILAWGLLLILIALPGIISSKNNMKVLILILVSSLGTVFVLWNPAEDDEGILTIRQSPYTEIKVLDKNGQRHMLLDGGIHTIVDPVTWESHYPYAGVIELCKEFVNPPDRMLLIGLGGGSIAKSFAASGWVVDAVEIDDVVTRVAREYFGLREDECEVYHMDGRQYLTSTENAYDVIILDAFGSSSIPFHLITQEAFAIAAKRLKQNGVLAINIESMGWDSQFVRSIAATIRTSLPQVVVAPAYKSSEDLGNIIILASRRKLERNETSPPTLPSRGYLLSMDYRRDFAWANHFEPETETSLILTDDLNPVDIWSEEINYAARQYLHEYFRDE